MFSQFPVNPQDAAEALTFIITVVAGVIGWILRRRTKAKTTTSPEAGEDGQNLWVRNLLAERETLQRERQAERKALIAERDKANEHAAEAWRVRESLATQLATMSANNQSLQREVESLRGTVNKLVRAIHRLDPKLLDAFGSDFTPLT